MSLKSIFSSVPKVVASQSLDTIGSEIESAEFIEEKQIDILKFVPPVDYSRPSQFAKFGLASKYYSDAYVRISQQYPYDGSLREKTQFFNTSSNFDKWIYDNKYPRYTGYATISPTGWGSLVGSKVSGYGKPSTLSYIYIKGGPNTSGSTLVDKFKYSNYYSEEYKRASNLDYDLTNGVTLEFWLNKTGFDSTKTEKEVVFDLWNNQTSSSANYGRLILELTSSTLATSSFYLTAQSGTNGFTRITLGDVTTSQLTSSGWNQYSVILKNSGSSINTKFYVNGQLNDNITFGTSLQPVTGAMLASIGSLVTAFSGTATDIGWGKLSGSLDEFRFWKTARTEKDIQYYWFTNVDGGTNVDDANTDLGVYYKFNEGIVGTSSYDSIVLDYSGRISNGSFVGYEDACRNTSSALISYGFTEEADPVVYNIHPQYTSSLQTLINDSFQYDTQNNAAVYNYIPQWIRENEEESGEGLLPNLIQTIAVYFDNLYQQISYINKIKNINYTSGSNKPIPFANRLIENSGLITPEIFVESEIAEFFANRTDSILYEGSLSDVKNKIYLNIYNNLTNILKSKGTEKAYRNLIRCFGVDSELIKINLYADNTTYKLKDNTYSTAVRKKFADFNDTDRFDTTIYQYSDPSVASSLSYIPGNISASYMGMTAETEVIFPKRFEKGEPLYVGYLFLSSSLFGMHEANSSSASDTTWYGTDDINFQVYAVRPQQESKNAYFQLIDYNGTYVNLTSSVYLDVYNNSKWNFAVRIRPDKHENIDLINNTSGSTYTIEFYGVKTNLDTIESEFLLTQSVDNTRGKNFFTKAKRFYIGSHVLNFTSSQNVITRTDTKISTLKYWQTYLDDDVIVAHSKDASNYGSFHAYRNAYNPSLTSISGTFVPQIETLALNWDFTTITSSDGGDPGNPTNKVAQFIVPDATSGSLNLINRYGWLGDILNHQYTGRGDFYLPNDNQVVNVEYVYSAKQQLPESLDSLDTIQILTQDDLVYTRDTKPANYFYSFEKSMYQSISEEMLNMFGTIIEFNNLIGEPVNRYRQEYKDMSKLRQLFFERVQNTPSLDKYIDFYKWLDSAISVFIGQLTPASANVSEKIFNLVESHILERNKYWNKFPTIEFKGTDPEAGAQSINKLLYNWKFGHRPLSNLEADNADYWLNRAERDTAPLSSSISASNFARSTILSVAASALNRRYTTPTRYIVEETKQIKGGTNLHKNNKVEFLKIATAPHGPMDTDDLINIPANYLFVGVENTSSLLKDINDVKDPNKKIKYHFNVVHGRDYVSSSLGYGEVLKSDIAIPANFISGNITSGYNAQVNENFMSGVIITNIHNDVYGNDKEKPMQGPFTDRWVGGLQYRHVDINRGTDDYTTRPEGWKLLLGQLGTSSYQATLGFVGADYPYPEGNPDEPSYPVRAHLRAPYYRETTAKRPLNIRNIQYSTSSYSLGNFRSNYEAIHSVGRTTNNSLLIDQTGTINLAQTELKTILRTEPNDERVDFTLPTRTAYKTIIGNRFSAPGEIRTLSRGYLNRFAEELSAYNAMPFRNKQVIGDARRVNDNLTIESSSYTPEIIEGTIGYNYNQLLSRHADFGGLMSGSATIPSIHKVNRNPVYRFNDAGLVTNYNNGFVSYQIPRKDSGYAWITASLTQGITSGNVANFGHVNSFVTTPQGTSSVVKTIPFVSNSDVGLNSAGQFVLTGATNTIDSVGLNSVIVEETGYDYLGSVSASLSSLTSSIVTSVASEAGLFNALMVVRNGLYQYPTFKQLYRSSHPSVRLQIKNSQFGNVNTLPINVTAPFGNQLTIYTRNSNRFFTEPFVVYRKPILLSLGYNDGKTLSNVQLTFSNQNETEYFCDDEFNYLLGLTKCYHQSYKQVSKLYLNGGLQSNLSPISKFNSLRYEEDIYPSAKNKHKKVVRKRTRYDNQFWRDSQSDRITQNNTSSFGSIIIASQSMWPLDSQTSFSNRTTSSSGVSSTGNGAGILQNNNVFFYKNISDASSLKLSPLFSRKHMVQNIKSHVAVTGKDLNDASSPIPIGFGEAYWSAPQRANILNEDGTYSSSSLNPFYNSYDDYADDMYYIGKNGSLIPEFRIENKIEDYLTSKNVNVLNDLQIIGADSAYSINTTDTFYKTFSNSEFMKNFSVIKEDHKDLVDPFKLTLECNAYIKFVPYKGFFPADRTIDIATAFSSSYLPYVSSSIASSSYITASVFSEDIKHRNFITPFMAPGILFNTIKSGIAVDYALLNKPVLDLTASSISIGSLCDSDYSYRSVELANTNGSGSNVMIVARIEEDATITKRLPFEAILQPDRYVKNLVLYDFESHPSASTNLRYNNFITQLSESGETPSKSILQSDGDKKYKYMINNFLAESVNFFLADQKLSSISSKPENTLNLKLVSGSVYGARLKMYRSLNKARNYFPSNYELPQDPDANIDYVLSSSILDDANSASTSSLLQAYSSNNGLHETFTMYSRPTAFGPDFAASYNSSSISPLAKNKSISNGFTRDSRIGFNPIYTPPYYYGESWADIIFKATETKQYTIQEIIQNSSVNYLRFDTRVINWTASVYDNVDNIETGSVSVWPPTYDNGNFRFYSLLDKSRVNTNSMQLSASLNIQNYKTIVNSDFNSITNNRTLKTGDTTYAWNIETKFETPMFNFNDISLSGDEVSTSTTQTIPFGIWHQFGKIPQDNEGVFMQIGPIPQNWLQYHPAADDDNYYNASTNIKDLTQLVGFSTEPVKLGKIEKTKKVYEAVVAVPYVEEEGVKKFFEIPRVTADVALGVLQLSEGGSEDAGDTIKQLSSYLDKYVFPPMFDFKTNKETTPVSMYVFEFDYDLGQNDLSYIWQNLPPVNSRKVEKKTSTISHKLLYNELMGHANALKNQTIDSNIQWMVFKVKQKAKVDYSEYLGNKVVDTNNSLVPNNTLLQSKNENLFSDVKYSYNWPYDFFSIVELADIKTAIDFEQPDENSKTGVFVVDKLTSLTGSSLVNGNLGNQTNSVDVESNRTNNLKVT